MKSSLAIASLLAASAGMSISCPAPYENDEDRPGYGSQGYRRARNPNVLSPVEQKMGKRAKRRHRK